MIGLIIKEKQNMLDNLLKKNTRVINLKLCKKTILKNNKIHVLFSINIRRHIWFINFAC
jgi:hypothetical protein